MTEPEISTVDSSLAAGSDVEAGAAGLAHPAAPALIAPDETTTAAHPVPASAGSSGATQVCETCDGERVVGGLVVGDRVVDQVCPGCKGRGVVTA